MKAIALAMWATMLFYSSVVIAAQRQASDEALQQIRVSVKNNRLAFATRADYDRAVGEAKPEVRARIFERLKGLNGFQSLAATPSAARMVAKKTGSAESITDDDFGEILNSDLVVQIGDFIFKVDPASEKVYALPVAHEAEYADLIAGRTSNPHIRQFSTTDAVLDLVGANPSNQRALFCNESGIGNTDDTDDLDIDQQHPMVMKVKYRRWGIYFTVRVVGRSHDNATITLDLAPVYYHVRCGTTVGPYTVTGFSLGNNGVYHSYRGSIPLNQVYVRAQFHGKATNSLNVTSQKDSRWLEIRQNFTVTNFPPAGLDYPRNPRAYTVGQYSTSAPTLARGPVTSWTIAPPLPAGMKIDPGTGVIDGVPSTTAPAADRTVTAANAYGSTTKLLHMAAVSLPVPPSNLVYPVNHAIYVVNEDIVTQTPAHGGGNVTSWSAAPPLPPGLHLENNGDVWGRPTAAQAARAYAIIARNAGGSTSATLTIEVRDPGATLSGLAYLQNPATYTVGTAIPPNTASLASGVPYSGFTVVPALPDGLRLSGTTGEIRGTPQHEQPPTTYTVTALGSTAKPGASVQLRIAIGKPDNSRH